MHLSRKMSDPLLARLLQTLKVTVESLLERQAPDVWHVYGGLNRLCAALTDILFHGFKLCDAKGNADLWTFIQGLNWLQPSLFGCVSPGQEAEHFPEAVKSNKAMQWIYCHVENHSIAEKLSWLLSDREHLINCYHEAAFMCQPKYAEAMLVCLKAVEENQLGLLTDVDPSLYVIPNSSSGFNKAHRRCASFPQAQVVRAKPQEMEMPVFAGRQTALDCARVVTGIGVVHGSIPREGGWQASALRDTKLRRCRSLPTVLVELSREHPLRLRSRTVVSKISPSVLKVEYSESSRTPRASKCRRKRERPPRTFMEDGGTSVRPAATGYFPRPTQGQSLTSFLSSGPFTSADLDRENAHFRISEAMISAIEQVKCNRTLRLTDTGSDDGSGSVRTPVRPGGSSDAERQRLRRRRTRPDVPLGRSSEAWGDRDTTTSEQTPSPPTSSGNDSTDDTAGSDAEQLALSLLRQFEDKQLPRASELEWLVSEQDAPQELLPMPGGWPVGPNEGLSTPLRGTADWAPPRPQLIFTVHATPVRKLLLAKQNLRCAGCGSKVAAEYASRFRYCEYLGKFFCTGCHTNQLAVIPARVIHNWDFNRYPVSTFSYRLLEKMATDPLFRIDDLNPKLYRKVKALDRTRAYRLQLHFLKDFLIHCRFADHLKDLLTSLPSCRLGEPDLFSLRELARVRSGELPVDLQAIVKTGITHVDTCDLCQARGFLCELCHCKATIFPWALGEVSRCARCGACFHKKCFKPPACPRCVRLAARQVSKIS